MGSKVHWLKGDLHQWGQWGELEEAGGVRTLLERPGAQSSSEPGSGVRF